MRGVIFQNVSALTFCLARTAPNSVTVENWMIFVTSEVAAALMGVPLAGSTATVSVLVPWAFMGSTVSRGAIIVMMMTVTRRLANVAMVVWRDSRGITAQRDVVRERLGETATTRVAVVMMVRLATTCRGSVKGAVLRGSSTLTTPSFVKQLVAPCCMVCTALEDVVIVKMGRPVIRPQGSAWKDASLATKETFA